MSGWAFSIKNTNFAETPAKMKKVSWFYIVSLLLLSCNINQSNKEELECPRTTIYLQPFDNYSQQEAEQLKEVLEKKFLEYFDVDFVFEVLPNRDLTTDLMNDPKTRYRADKIIRSLAKDACEQKIIIGLTHKDVSCSYKGKQDWGVLGLCLHGTHACVASDFRVKNKKRDYWKVVTHEFTHTFYHYSHCPKDDPTCIMKDAKGKPDLGKQCNLCETCKSQMR